MAEICLQNVNLGLILSNTSMDLEEVQPSLEEQIVEIIMPTGTSEERVSLLSTSEALWRVSELVIKLATFCCILPGMLKPISEFYRGYCDEMEIVRNRFMEGEQSQAVLDVWLKGYFDLFYRRWEIQRMITYVGDIGISFCDVANKLFGVFDISEISPNVDTINGIIKNEFADKNISVPLGEEEFLGLLGLSFKYLKSTRLMRKGGVKNNV